MKKILLFVVVYMVSVSAFAQRFQHGIVGGVFFSHKENVQNETLWGLTYSPRIVFIETAQLSVSVGLPLTVGEGLGGYNDSTGLNDTHTSFMLNVPVIVNLNIGAGSSWLNKGRVGAFVGGGYAYHYSVTPDKVSFQNELIVVAKGGSRSLGPVANAGLRFRVGKRGQNMELRFSYFKTKMDLYGIQLGYNFKTFKRESTFF
jgi:hypothetical protein